MITDTELKCARQAIKHDKVLQASRKLARIVTHGNLTSEVIAERTALENDMPTWLRHHGAEAFDREWSLDHLIVLKKIGRAINEGGLFALAMPRGHGKTTILKWSALYVMLTGKRKYVTIVAATAEMAGALVDFCRGQITDSDTLHAHYPHVTTYVRATEGKAIKARFQLRADGKSSGLIWSKTLLVLPDVADASGQSYPSNGSILEGHGLTGAIRGRWKDSKTGRVMRPDFVILDDPQTRESAESESQCDMRERIISGDVLGLAGPRKRIAAVMPCTVIRKGDLAARFLSHADHPEWQGLTTKLVETWPHTQDTLWREYVEIYKEDIANGLGLTRATEFYSSRRAEMDAGAAVAWEARYRDGEISALQTAENLLIETGPQFWAEYQNSPLATNPEADYILTAADVRKRLSGLAMGQIPSDASAVALAVDLNKDAASWAVLAGTMTPVWCAIDYGKWKPPGRTALWSLGEKASIERAIFDACNGVVAHIRAKSYGADLDAVCIDAGGEWASNVYAAVAALSKALKPLKIYAARGLAGDKYEVPKTRGVLVRRGYHADVRRRAYASGSLDMILYWDSHYWHMATQRGWLAPVGSQASLAVWGVPPMVHPMFADECAADVLVSTEIIGEKVKAKFDSRDKPNHWGDCVAMAAALLSTEGIMPDAVARGSKRKRVENVVAPVDGGLVVEVKTPETQNIIKHVAPVVRRAAAWERW